MPATPVALASLLASLLATDTLAETESHTRTLTKLKSANGETFLDALRRCLI